MASQDFDIAVVGVGMAIAAAAAFLSSDECIVPIEAEGIAGYHTTGRSVGVGSRITDRRTCVR